MVYTSGRSVWQILLDKHFAYSFLVLGSLNYTLSYL